MKDIFRLFEKIEAGDARATHEFKKGWRYTSVKQSVDLGKCDVYHRFQRWANRIGYFMLRLTDLERLWSWRCLSQKIKRRSVGSSLTYPECLEVKCLLSGSGSDVAECTEVSNLELINDVDWIPPIDLDPTTIESFRSSEAAPFPLNETFQLNSLPGADHTIYLDFTGHTTSGTGWNTSYNNGNDFTTSAYDRDGDSGSFSDSELENIQLIWQRVAEDFAPFQVNVTTTEPPTSDLINSGGSDTRWGVRVVIGGHSGGAGDWFPNSAGGVAYITSFNSSTDTPAFVFEDNLSNGFEGYIGAAASHEVGHTLGLYHDGNDNVVYYNGHGSGETGWGPIMGTGYTKYVTQWSKGEYVNANNQQDDLSIITSNNGFGYRIDDHGDSNAAATEVTATASGIIEQNTDTDVFRFTSGGGSITIDVNAYEHGPNLDILASLYDTAGNLVSFSNPLDSLGASISATLSPGTYYIHVTGTGKGNPLYDGYSDYGSLGQYTVDLNGDGSGINDLDDQISEAVQLGNLMLNGFMDDPNDVDMYAIDVNAGDNVTFQVSGNGSGLDSQLRLFDGNGNQLALDDSGIDSLLNFTFGSAGAYFVAVSQSSNDGFNPNTGTNDDGIGDVGTGFYTLNVSGITIPDLDSDDQISQAIKAGNATYSESISDPNDADIFEISVNAGDTVSFDIDVFGDNPGFLDTYLQLFDVNGTLMAYNDDGEGNDPEGYFRDSYLLFTFPEAGTYYIAVSEYFNTDYDPRTGFGDDGGFSTYGDYNLTITGSTAVDLIYPKDLIGSLNGNWWVAKSDGTSGFTNQYWGAWDANAGWTDVQTADVDGDGDSDVVGRTSTGQWWVARNTGSSFNTEYWGYWSDLGWQDVLVADVDNDGDDDIVGRSSTGQWWVARSNGVTGFTNELWGGWVESAGWSHVQIADLNGDGNADIIGQANNGQWWAAQSNGSSFSTEYWGYWVDLGWQDVQVADVDNDGDSDLVGRSSTGQWWVARSNGSDQFANEWWGGWVESAGWMNVLVTDLDGDGNQDIIGQANNGQWWAARSDGSSFSTEYWGYWVDLGWQDVQIIDVNQDGNADVVGRTSDGYLWVARSNGTNGFTNELWGQFAGGGWQDVMAFNGGSTTAAAGAFPLVQAYYKKHNKTAETVNIGDDPAVWLGMGEDLDGRIGAVLDRIDQLGIAANTYVILVADNGYRHKQLSLTPGMAQPHHGAKWWVWQGGIRVPMIAKGPGIQAGATFEGNVVNYDFLPTFVEWAGGNPKDLTQIDGVSLASYMSGREPDKTFLNRNLYFHYPHYRLSMPHSAIVSGHYKLLHFYERADIKMLFDLSKDVGEVHNIAKTHTTIHERLFSDIMSYLEHVGARLPKLNPQYDPEVYDAAKEYKLRLMWGPFEGDRPLEYDEIPQPQ